MFTVIFAVVFSVVLFSGIILRRYFGGLRSGCSNVQSCSFSCLGTGGLK